MHDLSSRDAGRGDLRVPRSAMSSALDASRSGTPTSQECPPPPALVRLERRLGLPVPVRWRPWVAQVVLDDDWLRRRQLRLTWLRRNRRALAVAAVVVAAACVVVLIFGFHAGGTIGGVGGPLFFALISICREQVSVEQLQARTLRWNGLRPDGSLDPAPDRWTTLATLPAIVVAVLAILEPAAAASIVGGCVAFIVGVATR